MFFFLFLTHPSLLLLLDRVMGKREPDDPYICGCRGYRSSRHVTPAVLLLTADIYKEISFYLHSLLIPFRS